MKTIHEQLKETGLEISNYRTDSYVKVTQETMEIVIDYEFKTNVTMFVCNISGCLTYDIPFAYQFEV